MQTVRQYLNQNQIRLDERTIRFMGIVASALTSYLQLPKPKVAEGQMKVNTYTKSCIEIAMRTLGEARMAKKRIVVARRKPDGAA